MTSEGGNASEVFLHSAKAAENPFYVISSSIVSPGRHMTHLDVTPL